MSKYHVSVLLKEVLEALQVKQDRKYIDGTLGGGGHASKIVERGGIVLGIDQDDDAIEEASKGLQGQNVRIVKGNFSDIKRIAKENGFEKVNGILLDIGVSSHQLDDETRGFSFLHNGPLDMRMDKGLSVRAADLINGLTNGELVLLFTKFGEEPFAKRIANAITRSRKENRIETTSQLAELIAKNAPKIGKAHQATRVFQALRITVNNELHALEKGLNDGMELLVPGGRLVIISFHSLEDRIVKHTFEDFEKNKKGIVITKKPITPTREEIEENKKSRSARMRVFEKI